MWRGNRRRAGDAETERVEPDQSPHGGEGHGIEEVPRLLLVGGDRALTAGLHDRQRGGDGLVELLLLLGVGGERGVDTEVHLLPHPRYPEHHLRVDLSSVGGDLRGVGTAGDREPEAHPVVVGGDPLSDVGHRQVRDVPQPHASVFAQGELVAAGQLLAGVDHVVLADHHALRRPCRAGCVDQRGEVVGISGLAERLQIRGAGAEQVVVRCHVVGNLVVRRVDDEDATQTGKIRAHLQEPLQEPNVLNDRDLRLSVIDEVLQLLRRRRVVDRHRGCPQERRRDVDDMELGPVADHHHHPLSRPQTSGLQTRRHTGDLVAQLPVRHLLPPTHAVAQHAPQGDHARVRRRRPQEDLRQRVPRHQRIDLGGLCAVIASVHGRVPPQCVSPRHPLTPRVRPKQDPPELARCVTCGVAVRTARAPVGR